MRRIGVDTLRPQHTLTRPLYHESGYLLFHAGERLEAREIEGLLKNGIRRLYDLGEGDDSVPAVMTQAPEPGALPDEVQGFLRERRAGRLLHELEHGIPRQIGEERLLLDPRSELRNGGLARTLERSQGQAPEGRGLKERLEGIRPDPPRPALDKDDALSRRADVLERLAEGFAGLRSGSPGRHALFEDLARRVLELVVHDPELAVAMRNGCAPPPVPTESAAPAERPDGAAAPRVEAVDRALAEHSLAVSSIALVTAIELGYDLEQLLELAYGAVLHDLGMLRLPASLVAKPEALSEDERAEVNRHPIYALAILRRFDRLPLSVPQVAYCEHERPDGSGYPEGVSGGSGPFAAVVACADVFCGFATARPDRPALPERMAIKEAVGLASKRQLDAQALRAMMKAVGRFPTGSYVQLSDGRIARVVRQAEDASRPWVAVIEGADVGAVVRLSEDPSLSIADVAEREAPAHPLEGF